jgi:hypothetical protein
MRILLTMELEDLQRESFSSRGFWTCSTVGYVRGA